MLQEKFGCQSITECGISEAYRVVSECVVRVRVSELASSVVSPVTLSPLVHILTHAILIIYRRL